jgi:hypothetical protein
MNKIFSLLLTAAFIFMITGCDKTQDYDGLGRLSIKVTDDPFNIEMIESATVTISKVEIRKSSGESGDPFIVLSEDTVTFDLIDLRNGVMANLLDMEVPAGEYDLVRLYVSEASLTVKDMPNTFKVKVPSGEQTGIKIFIQPDLIVNQGLTAELLLDFDLSDSFVIRGNPAMPETVNGFIFKPVIRASNLTTSGRVEGLVHDEMNVKVKGAKVWIARDTVVATAITDTMGFYAMLGIPEGVYTLYANKEGYDTVKFSDVIVISGNRTIKNLVITK